MKSKRSKGEVLEKVVELFEKALKEHPSTLISRNVFLTDKDGVKREIDVYVELEISGRKFQFVIECKHYGPKSYVKMDHIESFHSKLSKLKGSNKGIFVSTGPFQSGAKIKAKAFDIDLYTITENTEESFLDEMHVFISDYRMLNAGLTSNKLKKEIGGLVLPPDFLSKVFIDGKEEPIDTVEYIRSILEPQLIKHIEENRQKLFKPFYTLKKGKFQIKLNQEIEKTIRTPISKVFFKYEGNFYPIDFCDFEVGFKIIKDEVKSLDTKSYNDISSDKLLASIFSHPIKVKGKELSFNLVKVEGKKDIKIVWND